MKVRTVKKLRKKLESYEIFEVSTHHHKHGKGDIIRVIKAEDHMHALLRYFMWYWRFYKEMPVHNLNRIYETTKKYGSFVVTDSKGYSRYYF